MNQLKKHLDVGSLVIIVITLVLFLVALFIKGFGHGLLLEAGVFLVSVKLIFLSFKQSLATESLKKKLDEICSSLERLEGK